MNILGGYCLGFYWGSRKEDAAQCAKRTWRLFSEVKAIDPTLNTWSGVDDQGRPVPLPDPTALHRYIGKGVNRDDVRHEPIPQLGFTFWLRCQVGSSTVLRTEMSIGQYDTPTPNCCLIYPPSTDEVSANFLRFEQILNLGAAVVRCFEPEDGMFDSGDLIDSLNLGVERPKVGWIVYLSRKYNPIPVLPSPIETIPCDDAGTFIVVSKGPFSVDRKDDLARIHKLRSLLQRSQKPQIK